MSYRQRFKKIEILGALSLQNHSFMTGTIFLTNEIFEHGAHFTFPAFPVLLSTCMFVTPQSYV
jgi:hypothetical protein